MGTESRTTIDLWRRFRPTPSQTKFIDSTARGRLFSSGYGSGKSMMGCREAIRWCVVYPGCRGLIGRLVGDELKTTTMVTFWKQMAVIGFQPALTERGLAEGKGHYLHNRSERYVDFWNGSRIYYRHLDDPDSLGSLELNFAFLDEGSEIDDAIYKTISSSRLRWHLSACDFDERLADALDSGVSEEEIAQMDCTDCPRGIWVCTNPGASGYLRAVTQGKVNGWDWIAAKPGDNPYNGPDYYAQMEKDRQINGDVWMRKFYEGSWEVFEGQRFTMFDRDKHVMPVSWKPTSEHQVVESWDFGHRETFVTWMAYHPKRNEPVVVFAELQVNEVNEAKDVADAVKEKRKEYGVDRKRLLVVGDPAGVASSQFSSVSPIGAYAALGIDIAPMKAGKNPQARADLLTAFLNEKRLQPDGSVWPGIMFGPNCRAVVESIINLRWKTQTGKAGEDPREQFLKKDDHGFDALGYGLCVVPPPDLKVKAIRPDPGVNGSAQDLLR
jgi:hypothetical protein